jgi:hypothetical protein
MTKPLMCRKRNTTETRSAFTVVDSLTLNLRRNLNEHMIHLFIGSLREMFDENKKSFFI